MARCPGTPSLKKQTASWSEDDPFGTFFFFRPCHSLLHGKGFCGSFFPLRLSADTPPKHMQLQKILEVFVQVHFLWFFFLRRLFWRSVSEKQQSFRWDFIHNKSKKHLGPSWKEITFGKKNKWISETECPQRGPRRPASTAATAGATTHSQPYCKGAVDSSYAAKVQRSKLSWDSIKLVG